MKRPSTGPTWFEDDQFLELEISFPGPPPSRWRLEQKIHEHDHSLAGKAKNPGTGNEGKGKEDKEGPAGHGDTDTESAGKEEMEEESTYEACAIYICSRIDEPESKPTGTSVPVDNSLNKTDNPKINVEVKAEAEQKMDPEPPPKKAIMKIRLQYPPPSLLLRTHFIQSTDQTGRIPSPSTQTYPLLSRSKQATTTLTPPATNEITALTTLTASNSSSTPSLLSWKQANQDCDAGIPGGYVVYILMEKLPGVRADNLLRELGREERDLLRGCFREAWLYVPLSFFVNLFVLLTCDMV